MYICWFIHNKIFAEKANKISLMTNSSGQFLTYFKIRKHLYNWHFPHLFSPYHQIVSANMRNFKRSHTCVRKRSNMQIKSAYNPHNCAKKIAYASALSAHAKIAWKLFIFKSVRPLLLQHAPESDMNWFSIIMN